MAFYGAASCKAHHANRPFHQGQYQAEFPSGWHDAKHRFMGGKLMASY
jgi:hypothetical protein